jgi:hypothetical protein
LPLPLRQSLQKNKMKILDVYMLILFTRLIAATRHVLTGRSEIHSTLDLSVQPVSAVATSRSAVATSRVAVGLHGFLFQPNRVMLSPGDHLVLDCYEDNLSLVKATMNLSEIDDMPAILICQNNSALHLEILDTAPHLYYSPNIPPLQRFDQNMMLALNGPVQSPTASTALAASRRLNSVGTTTAPTLPPYPSGPRATGAVMGQATGTGHPFNSGRLNPTQRTSLPGISLTTRLPVAPTGAPSLTLGATADSVNLARGLQAWAILGLGFVTMMLIV